MASNIYKDVVVIGNGPSAITLSYMLAGNWPYYSGGAHSNEFLQFRLQDQPQKSLVDQDLRYLSDNLEGRSKNPVSLLFDSLNHPDADLGLENSSLLSWKCHANKEINHVVLGRGLPGGCWQDMEGGILTISLGSWMELPDLRFHEWNMLMNGETAIQNNLRQSRATVGGVARYYQDYVYIKGLSKYFINNTIVKSIKKMENADPSGGHLWQVQGHQATTFKDTGEVEITPLTYITPHVVLATGNSDQPNRLGVRGEELPFVLHTLAELESLLLHRKLRSHSGKLLIIGAGLSAADAIIAARFYNIQTVHAFRRKVNDPELIFNKLPQNMYPEYHKVHQMMHDCNGMYYNGYKSHPRYNVEEIRSDRTVKLSSLESNDNVLYIRPSYVLVLIGKKPDLSFLPKEGRNLGSQPNEAVDSRNNSISIDPYSHQSLHEKGIFAMGPLVGENFVRFIQGGALAVTNYLHQKGPKDLNDT